MEDFASARCYVLTRLAQELPANLYYHGLHHTRDDVLPAAERLGKLAGLDDEDFAILQAAALYHELGFVEQETHHEAIGARIAGETLPGFGYSASQIEAVQALILATKMPQAPQTFLEQLLCDADLDSLGRDDYLKTSHDLRAELAVRGPLIPLKAWYERQRKFLSGHTYFTLVARELRRAKKLENVALLDSLIEGM